MHLPFPKTPTHIETPPEAADAAPIDLLEALLQEQQALTAVDRFAQSYARGDTAARSNTYRDLIPATPPASGEQYAFEVDLDACSGCKACVTACHALNGLEDDELWRNVGQLIGGSNELPVIQHVTTACHHCIEPACMSGCPVGAYEKDPDTGIVRHLDDQCIGCQYCTLMCPYDVPVYSHAKGIVRKCDMCSQRLAVGEAPACVQACPSEAIKIRTVNVAAVLDECEASALLPASPEPGYTVPTTTYTTKHSLPRNVLPADYYSVGRAHSHLPLVFMLVLTQTSVGAFLIEQLIFSYSSLFREEIARSVRPLHLCAALALGMLGLAASVFHLGRPLYAYRAVLGLRTSWLSREIVAFGVFAAASALYVSAACLDYVGVTISDWGQTILGSGASAAGLAAVFCSVMVYVDTRRPCWTLVPTTAKFLLTCLILGIPTALLVSLTAAALTDSLTSSIVMTQYGRDLCWALMALVTTKLLLEVSLLAHLRRRQHTPLKRSAMLMTGELSMTTLRRFFFGIVGGVVLPAVLLAESAISAGSYEPLFIGMVTLLALGLSTVGELHERYLFFAASVAPKMPGNAAS
jgi:Fe-S-cluster-containing dehydrogenase component/DMSO reductase anchor subunit